MLKILYANLNRKRVATTPIREKTWWHRAHATGGSLNGRRCNRWIGARSNDDHDLQPTVEKFIETDSVDLSEANDMRALLTIQITTADPKRQFSTLKQIQTEQLSVMYEERLNLN